MNASQTCTLSEAVSKQANGIILVWSKYADGAAENSNFIFTFVPRKFVSSHNGAGVVTHCSSATGAVLASKYVYVRDSEIVGYANNSADPTDMTSGFTATPRYFVLRYVIGV